MKRVLISVITAVFLLTMMIPGAVFASSDSLEPDDLRLLKEVMTDGNGNVIYVGYYNQHENLVWEEETDLDAQEESLQTTYIYDVTGEYLQEMRIEYSDGTASTLFYFYDEKQNLTSINVYSADGEPEWAEKYTYDSFGHQIRIDFQTVEGQQYVKDIEYDEYGREISSIETQRDNFDSEPVTWKTVKVYKDIDELSWSVTTSVDYENGQDLFDYTESWIYDGKGNLCSAVEYIEGELYRTTWTYGSNDQLLRREVIPEGDTGDDLSFEDYHYRSDGMLDQVTDNYHRTTKYFYTLKPFDDVEDTEYFALPVKWAIKEGITSGLTPVTFGPYENCTRAQAVTFLWRAAGQPEPTNTINPFQDVKVDDYCYKAVLWATEKGITKGVSADTFGTDESCNRGQIVTFLYRFKGEPGLGGVLDFSDVTEGDYYYGAILWAVADGVTKGTSDTTFSPKEECTRGQIVTFLQRVMAD